MRKTTRSLGLLALALPLLAIAGVGVLALLWAHDLSMLASEPPDPERCRKCGAL